MDDPKHLQPSFSPKEEIALNSQADELARQLTAEYGISLVKLGKVLAARQRVDQVQRVHIEQARNALSQPEQNNWVREFLMVVGGALLGAFIQGFIEAVANHKTPLIVTYVVAGFVGMGMVFRALRQR